MIAGAPQMHRQCTGNCFDVVIVGAGAAGMECALTLLASSPTLNVAVLEGSDRVGGRVYTTSESVLVNEEIVRYTYDHGAAWIHGTEPNSEGQTNPMVDYIPITEHVKVAPGNPWMRPRSIMQGENCMYLYCDGSLIDDYQSALEEHDARLNLVSERAQQMINDGNGIETTQLRLGGIIPRASNLITDFYFYLVSLWNGCDASTKLQLADFATDNIDDSSYTPHGDFPGPHCTVRSGMGRITETMCTNEQLRDSIQLETVVTRISKEDHAPCSLEYPIIIETSKNKALNAKACVVTVSAGCLQSFVNEGSFFGRPISDAKLEAISVAEMGCYKKVFLTFPSIQWPADRPFLGLVRSEPHPILGHFLLLDNLWAKNSIPSLEAILIGQAAEWAVGKPDHEIVTAVVEFLKSALPWNDEDSNKAPWTVMSSHITRWEENPLVRGAYSHTKLGGLARHSDAMQAPEWDERLIFAGEATVAEYEGSVHAALISGRRAANQLLQSSWFQSDSVVVKEEVLV